MMFQWANKQLEKLSETLAPPPSTPPHRYLAAVASQQEDAALAILNDPHEPLDPYTSLNQTGMNALHAAASNGLVGIIRQLIGRGVRVDLADYNGWTALHHASASKSMSAQSALATVKVLVEELGASVVMKDATAQTPYDVGSSQAVRGYLLPRQLQQETQECLDNGGAGLTPGIDMGGMKINYSNVAPPPVIGTPGAPPPPSPSLMNNNDPSVALMQPPPVRGINSNFSSPIAGTKTITNATATNFGGPPGPMHQSTPVSYDNQPFIPPPSNNAGDAQQQDQPTSYLEQPAPVQTPNQQPQVQHAHNIAANQAVTERPPKSNNSIASSSSGYALRGGNSNSAFVLSDSKYKPDGFHTSSNDKDLQAKYGHVENSFETSRKLAMPPPPMSEGVPPPTSGGSNPYSAMGAGNMRSVGYIGGTGRARYPTYCAVSDSVSAPPSLGGAGYSPQVAPPAPSYATFNPAAVQPNPVAQGSHTQQGSTGDQYTQYSSHYTTEQSQVAPPEQTYQWSGGHQQMQHYAQSNAAPAYAAQNNLSPEYGQQGYVTQHPQQSPYMQPQGAIANNSDGNVTTIMGAMPDAASMFATPHAEEKKDFFPTSNESTADTASTTVDVFSSPPPADSNATSAIMQQQQATGNDSLPAEQTDTTPYNDDVAAKFEAPAENTPQLVVQSVSTTQPSTSHPNANDGASMPTVWQGEVNNEAAANATSFFGASESTTTVKTFGGLPPPPVVVGSNGINPSSAPSNTMVGSSSLPPPPTMKSFPNQANTAVSAEDEVPNFSDISLTE